MSGGLSAWMRLLCIVALGLRTVGAVPLTAPQPEAAVQWLWQSPFRLDIHQRDRVLPKTLAEYRRQVGRFQRWYAGQGLRWNAFWELDVLLVWYKNACPASVTRGEFAALVAGIEHAIPWSKGSLA